MTYNVLSGTLSLYTTTTGTKNWRQSLSSNFWRRFLERVYETLNYTGPLDIADQNLLTNISVPNNVRPDGNIKNKTLL